MYRWWSEATRTTVTTGRVKPDCRTAGLPDFPGSTCPPSLDIDTELGVRVWTTHLSIGFLCRDEPDWWDFRYVLSLDSWIFDQSPT
jgi:hypothetical protein